MKLEKYFNGSQENDKILKTIPLKRQFTKDIEIGIQNLMKIGKTSKSQ